MSMKRLLADGTNNALRPLGVQLVRGYSADPAVQSFISARKTIAGARHDGVSIADYVDARNAEPGATAASVEAMLKLADLNQSVTRVCEIGPGTGRYAEKLIAAVRPDVYEMYETARDWLPHLRELPSAKLQPADGRTLAGTASASVDLAHANKLFVYIPLMTTVGYLEEMARVVRPGGAVAFDIITEECIDDAVAKAWLADKATTIYSMIPRQWTIDLLDRRGLSLLGSSFAPLSGGRTEMLVFRKRG